MKKMLKYIFIAFLVLAVIDCVYMVLANANYKQEHPDYIRVQATAYCDGTLRCDGKPIRTGVIAGKKEWYGKLIAVYEDNNGELGDFIGYFECLDTGGESIRSGRVVDIYNPSREWCLNFGRKNVIIVIIEGVG